MSQMQMPSYMRPPMLPPNYLQGGMPGQTPPQMPSPPQMPMPQQQQQGAGGGQYPMLAALLASRSQQGQQPGMPPGMPQQQPGIPGAGTGGQPGQASPFAGRQFSPAPSPGNPGATFAPGGQRTRPIAARPPGWQNPNATQAGQNQYNAENRPGMGGLYNMLSTTGGMTPGGAVNALQQYQNTGNAYALGPQGAAQQLGMMANAQGLPPNPNLSPMQLGFTPGQMPAFGLQNNQMNPNLVGARGMAPQGS